MLVAVRIAQCSINFSATIRLPMVAGWDHLLPARFGNLHPRFRTPVFSILVVGGTTLGFALVTILDVGAQEAFQLLNNTAGILYALTYLVMFAIPLKDSSVSRAIRGAALSGFLMTLLYVVLSIFPIIEVKSRGLFTAKIVGVVLLANLGGMLFYWRAAKR